MYVYKDLREHYQTERQLQWNQGSLVEFLLVQVLIRKCDYGQQLEFRFSLVLYQKSL